MSIKNKLALIGVNVGLTALLLGGLEFAASFVVTLPRSHMLSSYQLNHRYRPNTSRVSTLWVADNPEFREPYEHAYNAQGWLERYDVKKEKPEGTFRVFYLGDSFTAGTVHMDGSVPSVVEKALNESGDPGRRIEVINAGTESYSPIIHYVLLRYVLMEYDPDLIVLDVDMTDDLDDWRYQQTAVFDEDGNPVAVPPQDAGRSGYVQTAAGLESPTWSTRLRLFLYNRSHLYNGVADRFGGGATADPSPAAAGDGFIYRRWAWCQFEWDEATEEQVGKTLDWIARIIDFAHDSDVSIMVTAVPHYQQYHGSPALPLWSPRPHYEIERVALEHGAAYLNSYEALRDRILGTDQMYYYYRLDMHFNPRGYALWAGAHIEFLQDPANGLLPESFLTDAGPQ